MSALPATGASSPLRNQRARVGSALHGKDTEDSDLDLLVEHTSETTMMDIGAIRYELKKLLGISVDVLTPRALPDSFREHALAEATKILARSILSAYRNTVTTSFRPLIASTITPKI